MGCCASKNREDALLIDKNKKNSIKAEPEPVQAPAPVIPEVIDLNDCEKFPYFPAEDDFEYDPETTKLGSIFFTIHCVTGNQELVVKVKRAKDLIPQGAEYCDPFLTAAIYPDPDGIFSQKSKVHHTTNAPYLDETFIFTKVTPEVMEHGILEVLVHNNLLAPKNTVLGGLKFKLSNVELQLIMPTWLPLKKVPPKVVIQVVEEEKPVQNTPPELHTQLLNHLHVGFDMIAKGPHSVTKALDSFSVAPSLISSFSHASTSVVVKNQDYGKVHLSMHYQPAQKTLQVIVIAAKVSKPLGVTSLPNPYVKLYLTPDPKKTSKKKSKPQKGTLEPYYNESFDFSLENGSAEKKLEVSVWSHDLVGKSVFLGEASIRLKSLPENELVNKWIPLESMNFGELNCRISYDHNTDYLSIVVVKARGLVPTRQNTPPDPYVKIYLLPDKKRQTKKKTHFKKQTSEPDYNETITYFLAEVDNPKARFIQISVIDHGSIGGNETIGSFAIPLHDVMEGQIFDDWFPLIKDKGAPDSPI